MKQPCLMGLNCPYHAEDEERDDLCTYPIIIDWISQDEDLFVGIEYEATKGCFRFKSMQIGSRWDEHIYPYVKDGECPLVTPGSELDPIMYMEEDE
jgi:hypothetical protein